MMLIAKSVSLLGTGVIISYWFAYFFLGYRVFNKEKISVPLPILISVLFVDFLLVLANLLLFYIMIQSEKKGTEIKQAIIYSFLLAAAPFFLYIISKIILPFFPKLDINKYF